MGTAMLAACGGAGSGVWPVPQHGTSSDGRTAQATFTIKWTNSSAPASVRRRDTISPSAQSFTITINGAVAAVVNRTSSPTQSVSLNAPVGSDLFVFNIYDGLAGQGNLLGTASVVQLIVDGAANTVTASIQAVCAATNVTSEGNDPLLFVKTGVTGVFAPTVQAMVLAGQSSATFIIEPEDADGNVIISGTGGTVAKSITGSATVTAIDGSHISLTPVTGPRSTTPDTLTVAAPTCPQATVAVQHSPAIYTEGTGNAVKVYDWYGDLLLSATLTSGDVLIGYDTSAKKFMAYNASNGSISAYPITLATRAAQYAITPGSVATWSNYLHSVFAANGGQYYTYANSAIVNIASNLAPTAVGTSPLSTDSVAYSSATDGIFYTSFLLASLSFGVGIGPLQTGNPQAVTALVVDDADGYLYAFNASGGVAQFGLPITSASVPTLYTTFGFSTGIQVAGIDTDANNLYGISPAGTLYISNQTTAVMSFAANVGTPSAIVVLSTNTH